MIAALLIDDEPNANGLLKAIIENRFPQVVIITATVSSVQEARKVLLSEKIDLVFLDIQMPEENGFELFNYFPNPTFDVIFVTAYDQYAIQAFKHSAFDYLLKPIDPDLLGETLQRYLPKNNSAKLQKEQIQLLNTYITNIEEGKKFMYFNTATGFERLLVSSILYIEAAQNYCDIHKKDGTKIVASQPLKVIEERLPDSLFFRIHKSFIIALDAIVRYNKKEKKVILVNATSVEVSYRREQEFLKKIFEKS